MARHNPLVAPINGTHAQLAGLVTAGSGAACQILIVVVITRSLEPSTAGAFFTATALCLMLAGILRMDAGGGLVHALARGGTISLVWRVLTPVALLSITAGCAVTAARESLAGLTGVPMAVWVVLAAGLPVVVVADVLVAATRGSGTMRPTLLLSGIVQPLGQLAMVAMVTVGGTAFTWLPPVPLARDGDLLLPVLVAVWALPFLPVAVLAAAWLIRRNQRQPYGTTTIPQTGQITEFWRHTAPRSAAAAIQSIFQRLDILIIAVLAGPAPAAMYTAATRLKVVGQLAGRGLAQAVQPRLVRAFNLGDLAAAARVYRTATKWLVVITWPIWLGYAALAPWLLDLFGPGYAAGTGVALVLAATMMVATACGIVDVVLVAAGHTAASLINTAVAITLTVVLDVLLVPVHGALGAVLGWAGGVLAKNLLPLVQLFRWYGLHPFGARVPALRRIAPTVRRRRPEDRLCP